MIDYKYTITEKENASEELVIRFLSLAKCPKINCSGSLKCIGDNLRCDMNTSHVIHRSKYGNFYDFAPPDEDSTTLWAQDSIYASEKIARHYTGLWAFGHHFLYDSELLKKGWHVGRGETDIFYRLILQLVLEKYEKDDSYVMCDIGCGVGRCTYDLAYLFPKSLVLGLDISDNMLRMADRILFQERDIEIDLSDAGFGKRVISRRNLPVINNAVIFQANAERVPLKAPFEGGGFDLVLNINVIDRTLNPDAIFKSSMAIVKPGGGLLIAVSGSWQQDGHWNRYGANIDWCLELLQSKNFILEFISDRVMFREIINNQGAYEEYPLYVIFARRESR